MANFRKIGTDFTEGLRAPHYTNGRLLTAEDLQQEQQTQLEKLAHLGKAAGYGIVEGFQVSAVSNNSALKVTAGLGLNRKGHLVQLAADSVTLPVQPVTDEDGSLRRSSRFEECDDADDPTPTITSGAYLLTVSPLAQLEGSVPRKACDGTSTSTCANQWEVEGVEFKIIRLTDYKAPTGSRAGRNRNLLAHYFYGSDNIMELMHDPLQFPANYTGFSELSAEDFNECDLPLAVFYWSSNKIAFIDGWAVRRRLIHPYPAKKWTANISDRRQAEGQARFLQFQDHITDLQSQFGSQTDTIRAIDQFGYLPPVGILPVNPFELIVTDVFLSSITLEQKTRIAREEISLSDVLDHVRTAVLGALGSDDVFSLERFFGDFLPERYLIVHEDVIHDRLHQSWVQPPILLPPPAGIDKYFEYVTVDGTMFEVNETNFENILSNIDNNFVGYVYSAKSIEIGREVTGISGGVGGLTGLTREEPAGERTGAAETVPGAPAAVINETGDDAGIIMKLAQKYATIYEPRRIFDYGRGDDDEVDPLVEILVVDELLDPYRNELAGGMVARIDAAITALTGDGDLVANDNVFTSVNQAIANAYARQKFLWQAANFGNVGVNDLINLINKSSPPVFYVVFVRRQLDPIARPLGLPDKARQ